MNAPTGSDAKCISPLGRTTHENRWPVISGIDHAGVQTPGGVATAIFNVAVAQGRESIIELVTGILQMSNLAVNRAIIGWQKSLGAAAGGKGDDRKSQQAASGLSRHPDMAYPVPRASEKVRAILF
jgi:hypothetical protein